MKIGNSVKSIGKGAFSSCYGLTSIEIPNSVKSIGKGAFSNCEGLTSVTIPNSVTSIGEYAFSGCEGLTSVTIGNSVTSIGIHAFSSCKGLTSVTIPNSVTSIGEYAFEGCRGLTSVTIGNSVTSIGEYAFSECWLTDIYCYAERVPAADYAFYYSSDPSVTLHVPAASLEMYKATSPWSLFENIVAISAPTEINTLESTPQDIDELPDGKYLKNGKIIIIKDGKRYDAAGRCFE